MAQKLTTSQASGSPPTPTPQMVIPGTTGVQHDINTPKGAEYYWQQAKQHPFVASPNMLYPKPGAVTSGVAATSQGQKQTVSGGTTKVPPGMSIRRGEWLRKQLEGLYKDPFYANGTPERKGLLKEKAYEQWVVPYYNHIGIKPPSKEHFMTGVPDQPSKLQSFFDWWTFSGPEWAKEREARQQRRTTVEMTALSRTSKILAGFSDMLGTVTQWSSELNDRTNYPHPEFTGDTKETVTNMLKAATQKFRTSEDYYRHQAAQVDKFLDDYHNQALTRAVSDVATQAIFFEASGGGAAAKAAGKLFTLANPETASMGVRVLQKAYRGAATGFFWSPTTSDRGFKHSGRDAAIFAGFDVGMMPVKAMFSPVAKFISSNSAAMYNKVLSKLDTYWVNRTISQAATKLVNKEVVAIPAEHLLEQGVPEANSQAAEAYFQQQLNELAKARLEAVHPGTTFAVEGAFQRLSPEEQQGLVVYAKSLITDVSMYEKPTTIENDLLKSGMLEQETKSAQVSPNAGAHQQDWDRLISELGLGDTQEAKLGNIAPEVLHGQIPVSPAEKAFIASKRRHAHLIELLNTFRRSKDLNFTPEQRNNNIKSLMVAVQEEYRTLGMLKKIYGETSSHIETPEKQIYYHGTSLENVNSIYEHGLRPRSQSEMEQAKVFITRNPAYALKYPVAKGSRAIVIVETSPFSKFDKSTEQLTHEASSTETIPPDNIKTILEFDENGFLIRRIEGRGAKVAKRGD